MYIYCVTAMATMVEKPIKVLITYRCSTLTSLIHYVISIFMHCKGCCNYSLRCHSLKVMIGTILLSNILHSINIEQDLWYNYSYSMLWRKSVCIIYSDPLIWHYSDNLIMTSDIWYQSDTNLTLHPGVWKH